MSSLPHFDLIQSAILKLADRLSVVCAEDLPTAECGGRILAEPLNADRDSPSHDVSAMDGYAIRFDDLHGGPLPVSATVAAGHPPVPLEPGTAQKIFTGAPVPRMADCVVRREDTVEQTDQVLVAIKKELLKLGQNIRRQGENLRQGEEVLPWGTIVASNVWSSIATFASRQLKVFRKVRVGVINTGDELVNPGDPAQPWQIRDSNGPLLAAWLRQYQFMDVVVHKRVGDDFDVIRTAIHGALDEVDAIVLTGGVSMGDADYVPRVIDSLGGEVGFHGLPIRPGKPVLGAALDGKLILGLPGNPVSVAVTARLFGLPLLRRIAGALPFLDHSPLVRILNPDNRQLDLHWCRLVKLTSDGEVSLVPMQGSGDVVALARSDGFVEVPAHQPSAGQRRFFAW